MVESKIKAVKYEKQEWGKEEVVTIVLENYKTLKRRFYRKSETTGLFLYQGYVFEATINVNSFEIEYKNLGKYTENFEMVKKKAPETVRVPLNKKDEQEPIKYEKEVKHEKYNQIKACVENNIPVYLVGPAGSGKNHTLEQIAKDLELDFYFTNSVQQEFKLTGFIDAGGKYHETEFYKAFKDGGLFFLDEMDASIPEVLVLLNAAIANGYFEFPNGKINANENFRVVSAGNTVGNGADEQYTGRLVLDQATLDRFAIIDFDYSEKIELCLAKGNKELVKFIRDLRERAKRSGIRATFSYRCITMVTKLEGKLELKEIIKMAVVKGMDIDTIRTLITDSNNKYSVALREVA